MSQTNCCPQSAVGASILNCNFVNIKQEVKILIESGIDFVHLDVMDGNFVDDITFGPSFVANLIKEFPNVTFEVHMMVEHPMKFIEPMSVANVKRFIFHYEVTKDNNETKYDYRCKDIIEKIRLSNMEVAVAINPETNFDKLIPFVDMVDSVLIMTVRPGLGGQAFMVDMMAKVKSLRELYSNLDIELDGGVSPANIDICGSSGANRAVCGSALLKSQQKSIDVETMRKALFPIV